MPSAPGRKAWPSDERFVVTTKMAATAFEAIVAAIEIDAGRPAAEGVLERVLGGEVERLVLARG